MKPPPDRPPFLRVLLIFVLGLALVTALAALTYTPEAPHDETEAAGLTTRP